MLPSLLCLQPAYYGLSGALITTSLRCVNAACTGSSKGAIGMRSIAMHDLRMLIDGSLVEGGSSFDVINPATEEPFARCPMADEAQLDAAVGAARAAFPAWSTKSFDDRAAYILRLAEALEARTDEFARLLTAEQ